MHAIYEQGHSVYDIVSTIHKVLMTMEQEIRKEMLFEMLKQVAELKKRILEGLNSEIQLGQFLAKCASIEVENWVYTFKRIDWLVGNFYICGCFVSFVYFY